MKQTLYFKIAVAMICFIYFILQHLHGRAEMADFRVYYDAANALKKAADSLRQFGYGVKIFDAYRPFGVTVRFWKLIKDERYVANPSKGSGHNRGIAVDLTLYELKSGAELNMGTGFDNFSDTAHHSFENLPATIMRNRVLLKSIMTQAGFNALETEWWHYALPNSSAYSILDIPFKKLNVKSINQ